MRGAVLHAGMSCSSEGPFRETLAAMLPTLIHIMEGTLWLFCFLAACKSRLYRICAYFCAAPEVRTEIEEHASAENVPG